MSWADRRRHDLVRSHRVRDYVSPEDRDHAERLIDQIVEYEKLAYSTAQQGGDAADLERIEDAAWPVREVLRQLNERLPPYHHPPPRSA